MAEKLIRMIRSEEEAKGGPTEAFVHPDEVANYTPGGWVPAPAGDAKPTEPAEEPAKKSKK